MDDMRNVSSIIAMGYSIEPEKVDVVTFKDGSQIDVDCSSDMEVICFFDSLSKIIDKNRDEIESVVTVFGSRYKGEPMCITNDKEFFTMSAVNCHTSSCGLVSVFVENVQRNEL